MQKVYPRDLLTGLAVAGLMLPEAVAYAGIAGLAPARAIAGAIAGGLAYALLGRSRFAIVSPTSSAAAILAAALATLPGDAAARDAMATALVLAVGAIFLLFSLLRLGSLAGFISRPVLRGFAFGLAVTIIIKQLPRLAGVAIVPGNAGIMLADLLDRAGQWHAASIALGLGALAALLVLRKWPQLPGALIVIAAGIGLATVFDVGAYGVEVTGPIALAAPHPAVPAGFAVWARLMELAAPIALILFAESWGTMRALALRHGDAIAPNRELGALGLANLASALAQGMPVGAGFSAGSANEAAGATSRVSGIVASIALLLSALFAGPLIARIPEPVLAAVVIAALTHALSLTPLVRLFKLDRDKWFALAAVAGVLTLGVLAGMLVAVALSIMDLLYDLSHPSISELGQVGASRDYVDMARHADARPNSHIAIYRPNAPLIFANAESVLGVIADRARTAPGRIVVLSLEQSNDLDSTSLDAIGEFAQTMEKSGKHVILARAHDRVREVLAIAGLEALARTATYSVADAVAAAEGRDS